jgi:hypothetical protein
MPHTVDSWGASEGKTLMAIENTDIKISPRAYEGIE